MIKNAMPPTPPSLNIQEYMNMWLFVISQV